MFEPNIFDLYTRHPVWEREKISAMEYRRLPAAQRKKLLIRHGWPMPIRQACFRCGQRIEPKAPFGGYLLNAWLKSGEGRAFLLKDEGRRWLSEFQRAEINQ